MKRIVLALFLVSSMVLTMTACRGTNDKDRDQSPVTDAETTGPAGTEQETTGPEATEPEATEPETTEPEMTEPEVTEPETTEPEMTEPETTEPEMTEPEATEPETTEPVNIIEQAGVTIVDFSVEQPTAGTTIDAASFGLSTSAQDNTAAFNAALSYMANHPGTLLSVPKGVYRFAPTSDLKAKRITNGIIEGNGSEFLFSTANYFSISESNTLLIRNLTIDWDWDRGPRLASLVEVTAISGYKVTLAFLETDDASFAVNTPWETFNQFDADSLTPGCAGGKEFWNLSSNVSNIQHLGGSLVSASFTQASSMRVGEVYLLRHYTYHSSVFSIKSDSQNITIKDVTIYSALGSGVVVGSGAHHILCSGMTIGLRPGTEDKYRISTTVDAFHVGDSRGYFILEDCDVSFQGDDCLNIHDNVGLLSSISGQTITVSCFNGSGNYNAGAKIIFLDAAQYQPYPVEATVVTKTKGSGQVVLKLDTDISGIVPQGAVVCDTTRDSGHYIVRNCYFHENRARGLLLGSSDGLVENNRFYKTQGAAILIPVDIGSSWMEGTGVNNLVIRNNVFDTCNVNNWTPLISFTATINNTGLKGRCFSNVAILDNIFSEMPSTAINIACADNVTVAGNEFVNETTLSNAGSNRGKITVSNVGKVTIRDNVWYRSKFMTTNVNVPVFSSTPAEAIVENNILQ